MEYTGLDSPDITSREVKCQFNSRMIIVNCAVVLSDNVLRKLPCSLVVDNSLARTLPGEDRRPFPENTFLQSVSPVWCLVSMIILQLGDWRRRHCSDNSKTFSQEKKRQQFHKSFERKNKIYIKFSI